MTIALKTIAATAAIYTAGALAPLPAHATTLTYHLRATQRAQTFTTPQKIAAQARVELDVFAAGHRRLTLLEEAQSCPARGAAWARFYGHGAMLGAVGTCGVYAPLRFRFVALRRRPLNLTIRAEVTR